MKSFFGLIAILLGGVLLIGCVTTKSLKRAELEGTWEQVDGTSTITFKGRQFEILDMEVGIAGYGIVKFDDREGNILRLETTYLLYLNESTKAGNSEYRPKKFQIEALAEYHKKHPETLESLFKESPGGNLTVGFYSHPYDYILDENNLTIKSRDSYFPDRLPKPEDKSYIGQFIRKTIFE
jgi:hypothetical protein